MSLLIRQDRNFYNTVWYHWLITSITGLITPPLPQGRKRHTALPYLNQVPTKVSAALTARATLDAISNGRKLISTAANIGGLIEDEVKYRTLKDDYAALWQQLNRVMDRYKSAYTKKKFIEKSLRHHDIVIPRWSAQERIKVGLVCLELMRQSTGLIEINTRKNQHGKPSSGSNLRTISLSG